MLHSGDGRAVVVAAALAAGLGLGLALGARPTPALAEPADADDLAGQVLELTNVERQAAQLPPLAAQPALGQAAQHYAGVLAAGDCFAHTCGLVPSVSERTERAGYQGWAALGENIAAGQPRPADVVAAWMQSPEHRANILSPTYTEIGTGVVAGDGGFGRYWVEDFGAR
jgi:uncharacterized protein YkwD